MSRRLTLLLGVTLALALPAAAVADSVLGRDQDGVSLKRRALDISSVRVTGHEGLGFSVDVRFKGDVERQLGRGSLKRAGVVLVLHHADQSEDSVIVMQGGGDHERLRLRTSWGAVGAARARTTVKFLLMGSGFSNVVGVDVATIPRLPSPPRTRDGVDTLSDGELAEVSGAERLDDLQLVLDPDVSTPDRPECAELSRLYRDITVATSALDRRWRWVAGSRRPTERLVRNTRGLALEFGGHVELALNEEC
jgi:hypothetical protein